MLTVTREQARQFILSKQGLLGRYRFAGKDGAYQYIRQAGCIQYDPVDVCGKNAELTLQSRVKGFTKQTLSDLLYKDRLLMDYSDKELAIWASVDWPYFSGYRERSRALGRTFEGLAELEKKARSWKQLEMKIKELTAQQAEIENDIKSALETDGLETISTKTYTVNWKWVHSHKFDSKSFKDQYSDLYAAYQVPSDYRKFGIQ